MRKVFWCCVAAGAVVCCAFWAAGYVSQNPDSALGRCALAVCPVGPHAAACAPGQPCQPGTAATDDLVPDDPVPVDDPPPIPTPGSQAPPEVMALGTPPPIVIHDEEDLNASANPAPTEPPTHGVVPSTIDIAGADLTAPADNGLEVRPTSAPPAMPRCTDDDAPTPHMPYCTDDDPASAVGPEDVRKVGAAAYRDFDACAFWTGFFTGPTHLFGDAASGRCEEDVHYPQQYSGCPYTGEDRPKSAEKAAADLKPSPAIPGAKEPSEPPAKEEKQRADPSELFDHPHHLQISRPGEPRSDTMEMRPTDWKPYSLDPGPF